MDVLVSMVAVATEPTSVQGYRLMDIGDFCSWHFFFFFSFLPSLLKTGISMVTACYVVANVEFVYVKQ